MMRAALLAGLIGGLACLGCKGGEVGDAWNYVCETPPGDLRVVDVSDPTDPVEIGFRDSLYPGYEVDVVGGVAYSFLGGLTVIDVSNPAADPVKIGYLGMPLFPSLEIVGGLAYTATDRPSAAFVDAYGAPPAVRVIDISDPENPEEIGYLGLEEDTGLLDVDIVDGIAYVAVKPCPTDPQSSSPSYCPQPVTGTDGVAVDSSTTFTSASANFTLDDVGHSITIEDAGPDPPGAADSSDLTTTILTVTSGSSVVLADAPSLSVNPATWKIGSGPYLRIIDVSTPETPVEIIVQVGYFGTTGPIQTVEVVDELAYLGTWRGVGPGDLLIVDVSDPENPEEVDSVRIPAVRGYPNNIVVSGDLAYITTFKKALEDTSSLQVVDISDPADPARLGFVTTSPIWDLEVSGEVAYAAASSGLLLIDISDPGNPVEVGALPSATPYRKRLGVSVVGGLAYDVGFDHPSLDKLWSCSSKALHDECSNNVTPLPSECTSYTPPE
ncbi:MAG: hypothetical protein VCC04_11770 [Myxococcota bacterium]